jgi:hydroxymethylbilane synthase
MRKENGEFIPTKIRLGTRSSALARAQTYAARDLLAAAYPMLTFEIEIVVTRGDENSSSPLVLAGGKGLFTSELEAALRRRSIDVAVHSLKDLPTDDSPGLRIGAFPARANPADVIVSRKSYTLSSLPAGAIVGTGSPRRASQLLRFRRDLKTQDIRGNIDTRVTKALDPDGPFDAVIVAHAGLERLGMLDAATEVLGFDVMLPAPGQAALAVQCRDDPSFVELVCAANDPDTEFAVIAERAFLSELGGGCGMPIAALGLVEEGRLTLKGRVLSRDGSTSIDVVDVTRSPDAEGARELGRQLAQAALANGAGDLLGGKP